MNLNKLHIILIISFCTIISAQNPIDNYLSGNNTLILIGGFEDGVDKIRLEGGLNFSNLSITQGTQGSVTVAGYTIHYDFRNHTLVKAGSEYLFTIIDTQHNTLTSEDFIY